MTDDPLGWLDCVPLGGDRTTGAEILLCFERTMLCDERLPEDYAARCASVSGGTSTRAAATSMLAHSGARDRGQIVIASTRRGRAWRRCPRRYPLPLPQPQLAAHGNRLGTPHQACQHRETLTAWRSQRVAILLFW